MQAYKFETKISKTGQIKLTLQNHLFNKEVEIIIVPKAQFQISENNSEFIDKWAGFLKTDKVDDVKYQYISKKHK